MIEIEKELKVTITGKDAKALSETCELARMAMVDGVGSNHMDYLIVKKFINAIFDYS